MMRRCFELARAAVAAGSHPFGALLARGSAVLMEAHNTVALDGVTGHAELNLVRRALADLGREALGDCTLYASTEPCAMCAGAVYWARIPRVVFGCSVQALASVAHGSLDLSCRDVFAHGERDTEVIGPVLEDKALEVHRQFWPRPATELGRPDAGG